MRSKVSYEGLRLCIEVGISGANKSYVAILKTAFEALAISMEKAEKAVGTGKEVLCQINH
jgi:hypothetical protein